MKVLHNLGVVGRTLGLLVASFMVLSALTIIVFGLFGGDDDAMTAVRVIWIVGGIVSLLWVLKRIRSSRASSLGLFLLLATFGVLILPAQGQAATDRCAGSTFGCASVGPVKPGRVVSGWYRDHDSLPPVGCRWLWGTSIGIYPAFKVEGLGLKWLESYRFHARLTECWGADSWVRGAEHHASGRRITKLKVETWWSNRSLVTSTSINVQIRKRWYDCMISGRVVPRGCVDIKVQGQAAVDIPPGLGFTDVNPYPTVVFLRVAADGTYREVDYDRDPF